MSPKKHFTRQLSSSLVSSSPPSHFKRELDEKLIRLALHKNPFFTCLDEEQIERFVAAAELKAFHPGEVVILEGCVDQNEEELHDMVNRSTRNNYSTEEDVRIREFHGTDAEPADAEEGEEILDRLNSSLIVQDSDEALPVIVPEEYDEHSNTLTSRKGADCPDLSQDKGLDDSSVDTPNFSLNGDTQRLSVQSSQVKRSIYIVKSGHADVWYRRLNPASLGPATIFGEGGFLFNRQHSASVIASRKEGLECWVVDFATFCRHVLPSQNMSNLFRKHANKYDEKGALIMTMSDFVKAIEQEESTTSSTAAMDPLVSFRIANTYNILKPHSQRIYLADFAFFYLLMARPDPEVDIAFLLMDQRRTGQIQLDDLRKFISPIDPSLDFNSDFFKRYFGSAENLSVRHQDFPQFLGHLQREMGKQSFLRAVRERGVDGHLDPVEFVSVIKTTCGWRLPQGVSDRLETIYCHTPTEAGEATAVVAVRAGALKGATVKEVANFTEASVLADMEQREKNLGMRYFSYGDFLAFQEVLAMLPGIINLIDRAQEIKRAPVSLDDFKVANRVLGLGGRLSRRQVEIIFTLFDLDRDGFVSHEDTVSVCGVDFAQRLEAVRGRNGLLTFAPPPQFLPDEIADQEEPLDVVFHRVKLFSMTAFAGALGVVFLAPLEVVKTRLMNQRIGLLNGRRVYKNSLDCLRQVLRFDGYFGMYRGLTPQLLGAAPEKAIKLQVNNLLRQVFTSDDSSSNPSESVNLLLELVTGAGAGACQLLVSCPIQICSARMILQNETASFMIQKGLTPPPPQTLRSVVRDLGFPGLYRGALACMLRDVPFSAIYFPAYAVSKQFFTTHDQGSKATSFSDILLAGTLAGIPAALLTTPFDVIRLRIQVVPRPGESRYTGLRDCASKIYRSEGTTAFFRGASARVLRIAPQFGITLLAYEQITQGFGFKTAMHPPTNAPVDPNDYRTAFPASALYPKADDIASWMRNFGVLQSSEPSQSLSQASLPPSYSKSIRPRSD